MQCTLNIPHLIPPREVASLWQALNVPALKSLLARARYYRQPGTKCAAEASTFHDGAAAPLLAEYDGLAADKGYWLCATPVHLQMHHHGLTLTDPAGLNLTPEESQALAATIAAHLRADKLILHTSPAGRWFLQCDGAPAITTSDIERVIGRDVQPYLPKGADALRWHRLLTEMQMLLHAHAVNDAREAAGRPPVNSVWLWGGGVMREPGATPFTALWSDNPVVCAMARRDGCPVDSGTPRFPAHIEAKAKGHYYFSFHALTPLMRRGDLQSWSACVTTLERDWFQPLQSALRTRHVTRASLVSVDEAAAHRFEMGPWDNFKIFNKNKYLQ